MGHRRTIDPLPLLNVGEARDQARLTHNLEDAFLGKLIERATQHCESITKRAFVTQTWQLTLDGWCDRRYTSNCCIYVPRPRLIAVTALEYMDSDGDWQTLAASRYHVDASSEPGRITPAYGDSWPTTRGVLGDVRITHTAGYGAASAVPDDIKQAVLLMVGHWSENREAGTAGILGREVDMAIESLLGAYVMEVYA